MQNNHMRPPILTSDILLNTACIEAIFIYMKACHLNKTYAKYQCEIIVFCYIKMESKV